MTSFAFLSHFNQVWRHRKQWLSRHIFCLTREWDPELTLEVKKDIEKYWKGKIESLYQETYACQQDGNKFYVLSMFPYPSGRLHMGHIRVYTIGDAISWFYRLQGKQVIHPIGWDAFGLPAENAAREWKQKPDDWTWSNISTMKQQLKDFGLQFDWHREFATCDPLYYKWTQHLFLLMFQHGLAYRKEALVNWDPVDQTVLADEQVDENGRSWRSGAQVEKRHLRQWFIRCTAFSKALYDGLDNPDMKTWKDVLKLQRFWIGECSGYTLHFKVVHENVELDDSLDIWMDNPEFIFGATHVIVTPTHYLASPKFGKLDGNDQECQLMVQAKHPFTEKLLPIFVSDKVDCARGTESYLGVPGEVEVDKDFAKQHSLAIVKVTEETEDGNLVLANSGEFSGLPLPTAREEICKKARNMGLGAYQTSRKCRDWLISRQRYWGTPIPIIHCSSCKEVPVSLEDLPVMLPPVADVSNQEVSPLASAIDWVNVKCPKCGRDAKRETDTMDTFVDSSWYFLRYLDPQNSAKPFDTIVANELMPVDLYIGGKEHAYMHLYYARFVNYFLQSAGLLKWKEPFQRLVVQGMVMGRTFRLQKTGQYIPEEDVDFSNKPPTQKETGEQVIEEWEKMSKSKHNGIDPEEVISSYGIDATRLFILGNVTPESDRKWPADTFPGILNWQHRLWLTIYDFQQQRVSSVGEVQLTSNRKDYEEELFNNRNRFVRDVTYEFMHTFHLSVAISRLQALMSSIRRVPATYTKHSIQYERALASLIIMLSPLAPHFASELWSGFSAVAMPSNDYDLSRSVLTQRWPEVDMEFCLDLIIKVSKGPLTSVKMPRRQLDLLSQEAALDLAQSLPEVSRYIDKQHKDSIKYNLIPGYKAVLLVNYRK